ncbi:hypothetical protein EC991_008342 [Linnemannia zychae]|nr:hypothetical protein EC991_008342 [Linnemannia zychae]
MKAKNHQRQGSQSIKAHIDNTAGAALSVVNLCCCGSRSPSPKEPSESNIQEGDNYPVATNMTSNSNKDKPPAFGSEQWYKLGCPGLLENGGLTRNAELFDILLLASRITKGLGSVLKAQEEPKTFSGIFCSEKYLNGIRCIAEVSKHRGICEFHRKGGLRQVRCTAFTKDGLQCEETSGDMEYSQQQEWAYLCKNHEKTILQRGHRYRSGMPASLLARVEIGPSTSSKDLEDQKEHNDLTFVFSQRNEIIITADEFNDFDSSVGFKIGHSGSIEVRISDYIKCHCKVNVWSFRAFPGDITIKKILGPTKYEEPLRFVYLLEKIMHEIFAAHQYDISCKHDNWRGRTTHTEFFWFKSVPGDVAPYERTKAELGEMFGTVVTPWVEVLRDMESRFYGRLTTVVYGL